MKRFSGFSEMSILGQRCDMFIVPQININLRLMVIDKNSMDINMICIKLVSKKETGGCLKTGR